MADTTQLRPEPPSPPDLPTHVGPFRLLEKLGEGGMGVVWLAERREPIEQRVALKVIRSDRLDRTYRARFAMEQTALSRMDHPNIARLLDAGDDRGLSWFAMEYVPGQPLSDYCAEHRLSIEQRLALFEQICDGVQHAHVKGILHRDLKPGNILVREIDGRPVAKIIDFGLALPVDPLQVRATLHESARQIVGTFAYMSPEQALRTEGDLDTRTDVYSLGVVLYELLTGELPLDLDEVERQGVAWFGEYLREHEPQKPSTRLSTLGDRLSTTAAERCLSPHRLRSFVRGDLDWVTMKALARDRQRRYLTVQELRRDVGRFLRHAPVEAGPPSVWYSMRKFLRRHRTAVGLAAGAVVVAGTFVVMDAAHAATTLRLEREAALVGEPLVAEGLLEARWRFGFDEVSEAPARAWLERAQQLLDHAVQQRGRQPAGVDPALDRYLDVTLPAVESAMGDVAEVAEGIGWLRERMQALAPAWQQCAAAVCADERYGLAALPPQFGLAPLGKDPTSGLFEFELLDPRGQGDPKVDRGVKRGQDGALEFGLYADAVLVLLPGGTFTMGTDPCDEPWYDTEAARAETPAHRVALAPFFVGKYELTGIQASPYAGEDPSWWTAARFQRAMQELHGAGVAVDVSRMKLVTRRAMPVGDITWVEADRFARRLGARLPSEAEWEYAARAGSTGPWSCAYEEGELRRHANLADCVRGVERLPLNKGSGLWFTGSDGVPPPAPVGSLLPNAFGLYDVHGNLYEWCADVLRDYGGDRETESASTERKRVLRGGSFQSPLLDSRSASRHEASKNTGQRDFGMRLARDLLGAVRR